MCGGYWSATIIGIFSRAASIENEAMLWAQSPPLPRGRPRHRRRCPRLLLLHRHVHRGWRRRRGFRRSNSWGRHRAKGHGQGIRRCNGRRRRLLLLRYGRRTRPGRGRRLRRYTSRWRWRLIQHLKAPRHLQLLGIRSLTASPPWPATGTR